MPQPTRRIHLLARGIRKELQEGGPVVKAEWLREALIADLATNGRREVRIPVGVFFSTAAAELDVDLDVDDTRGEIVVRLIGEPAGTSLADSDRDPFSSTAPAASG